MPKVAIIGAGPAGSLAAYLLARAGFEVVLFEQHAFPRNKVCGECLSSLGIATLKLTGLAERVAAVNPVRFSRSILHPCRGPSVEIKLSSEMWGISRARLDSELLQAAKETGAVLHQPARCERVDAGDQPTIQWRCLATNQTTIELADWAIIADGKGLGLLPGFRKPALTGDLGIKTHFENITGPADAIELFGLDGYYGGLAKIEGDRWNAAFSVPVAELRKHQRDVESLFNSAALQNGALANRLKSARRIGPWLTSPLPRFAVTDHWPKRVIPIGNAAGAIEPIGGEGMGLALHSAHLAAQALIEVRVRASDAPVENLPDEFKRVWSGRAATFRGSAIGVRSPHLFECGSLLLDQSWPLAVTIASFIGK